MMLGVHRVIDRHDDGTLAPFSVSTGNRISEPRPRAPRPAAPHLQTGPESAGVDILSRAEPARRRGGDQEPPPRDRTGDRAG